MAIALVAGSHAAFAAAFPDLSIARSGPSTAAVRAPFTESLTITNHGSAATAGVQINYTPGTPTVTSSAGSCAAVMRGHSGRGGGYTRVGWACTNTVAGGLAPGASTTIRLTVTAPSATTLQEAFAVGPSPSQAQANVVSHTTAATVTVTVPPAPAAPTRVTAAQSSDQLNVSWTPDPATAADVLSSTITATPQSPSTAPTLTSSGGPSNGTVPNLQPATTYSVTVETIDAGGSSAPSAPIQLTTSAPTTPPGAPTITYKWWAQPSLLAVSWSAGTSGNSATDTYEVDTTAPDTGQTIDTMVAAPTTSAYVGADDTLDWTITIRAHNAAGWGPWSAAVMLGGV